MRALSKTIKFLIPVILILVSCTKGPRDVIDGGGGTGNCNTTVMKLKKWQATFDANHYIEAAWNTDGTIQSLKVNVPLSEYLTARYNYANGKIKEAILYDNASNTIFDTVVYHYDANGKVDSMYRKSDNWFDIKLTYSGGKLVKYTRYAAGAIMFYWNIITDANDNVIKAEEYWNNGGTFSKETTYTYTRDDKKNPLAGLAPYMMYLDDDYQGFWYWGPNNYTDQRYQDHTGTGIDLTTGYKFKYNGNCYPASSQNTIMGQPLFPDDDFVFTYY